MDHIVDIRINFAMANFSSSIRRFKDLLQHILAGLGLLPIKVEPLDLSLYGGRSRLLFQRHGNQHFPLSPLLV